MANKNSLMVAQVVAVPKQAVATGANPGPQEALAISIAKRAHAGQYDKGGHPYISHPAAVSEGVEGDLPKATAWLHDVVEDTEWTFDDLLKCGVDERVVHAVDSLTRRKEQGETYSDYIARVSKDPMAKLVKIADLWHNSDPARWRRGMNPSLRKRYKRSLEELGADTSGYILDPPYADEPDSADGE